MMRGMMMASLFLVVPVAALAVPPSTKPGTAPAAKAIVPPPGAPVRRVALSTEGRAIAARIVGAPDPRLKEIQAELTTLRQQKAQMIAGVTVDVEKLEPVIRREEALQAELRTRQNDRLMALLRALPDADRIALLHSMANPARPDGAKNPVPTTPVN